MSSTSSHSGGYVVESPELPKLRKICGYGHIFLIFVTIFCTLLLALSIVAFCIFLVIDDPTIMDQDRHAMIITMGVAVIDFAVMMLPFKLLY